MKRAGDMPEINLTRDRALALDRMDVSRETLARLDIYAGLLQRWSKVKNLVARSTLPELWTRHFSDSLQFLDIARKHNSPAKTWVDMGAGAGFPGLVLAMALASDPEASVTLIESDHRKCAFLRDVSRETGCRTTVIHDRIENVMDELDPVDCVTARALAPLDQLIDYAMPLLKTGALGLFPKGQHLADELTGVTRFSNIELEIVESRTDKKARIVLGSVANPSQD